MASPYEEVGDEHDEDEDALLSPRRDKKFGAINYAVQRPSTVQSGLHS